MHLKTISFVLAIAAALPAFSAEKLENIALGKKYTFAPNRPQYVHCTDEGDFTDLTDGKYVEGYFWVQKGCVGWFNYGANPKCVTVDLEKEYPIRGFSWNTASGVAGVKFPQAIFVYVSNDNKNWKFAGDLLARSLTLRAMPPPNEYYLYRAWCDDMYCRGRYVMFVAQQESCLFVDEVEVYKGPDELMKKPFGGIATTDPAAFGRSVRYCSRILRDAERVGLDKDPSIVKRINELDITKLPAQFKTILPLNDVHREIYAANSKLLAKAGYRSPVLWKDCRWDNLDPLTVPPKNSLGDKPLEIHMMRNETRGETLNILNPTKKPLTCTVTVKGLGEDTPLDCREVIFSDMKYFRPISGALKPGDGDSVTFEIPAGISKQVWISVKKPKGRAGVRRGSVVCKLSDGKTLRRRINVTVYDLDFPERPRCHAGGWDYCHDKADWYGCSPSNLTARLKLHKEMFIDTPWGAGGPGGAKFDKEGNLVPGSLDFTKWDNWTKNVYPDARIYCSFFGEGHAVFGKEKPGTERFHRMAVQYFRAWVEHARANGFGDRRILLLIVDEPGTMKTVQRSLPLMRAIRAAGCKELGVYVDPNIGKKLRAQIPEFWELSDVVCPHGIDAEFAKELIGKGKEVWLYSAFGPSRTFDPVSYYRMQPWRAFVVGGNGTFYWMLGSGGRGSNSFAGYMPHKGTDYSPYFVLPTDVMHAKQSMGMLESIQDFEYLSLYAEKFGREKAVELARRGIKAHPNDDCDWDRKGIDRSVADAICVEILQALDKVRQ